MGAETVLTIGRERGLEARLCRVGRDLALVAPPHPLMGGDADNPVVEAMIAGLQAGGISTLRFNFRGVGESLGEPSGDLQDAIDDYRCVVAWARTQDFGWLTFGGYSFGALAAIGTHVGGLDCHCVLAVAPPTASLTPETMAKLDCYFALVRGMHDSLMDGWRVQELLTHAPMAADYPFDTDHFFRGAIQDVREAALDTARRLVRAHQAEDGAP